MNLQHDLLGGPPVPLQNLRPIARPTARRSDPGTSHAAADQARELTKRHNAIIIHCLQMHGPLGKDGIAARTKLEGVQVCRRLSELKALHMIKPTGKKVCSTAGRAEREWAVV
ncbi:MAG TPA: hypothetical protein PK861_00225 [Thermomonas sp.]|mgnify:CR=1 FL=1|nr:hypothetical protein [Thermomonas sp.]